MRKIFWVVGSLNNTLLYPTGPKPIPTLQELSINATRESTHDPQIRENYKEAFKDSTMDWLQYFKSKDNVIGDFNFSEFNLSNIDIRGCTLNKTNFSNTDFRNVKLKNTVFNEVNLSGVDLRGTFSHPENFKGSVFNKVNLEGALLYGEKPEEYFYLKGYSSFYNLLRQYSDLRKKIRSEKNQIRKDILLKQTEAIQNLFKILPFDLKDENVSGFDLTGLNFENINSKKICFLEDTLIPEYQTEDRTPLFNLWRDGNDEQKKLMQILLNCGINLFKGVNNSELKKVNWSEQNLENSDFSYANLRDCNFIGVDLKKIKLNNAQLQNVYLSNSFKLPDYNPNDSNQLFNLWQNGNEEQKSFMQFLLNRGLNLFKKVENNRLRRIAWSNYNLENADFEWAELKECNFSQANLENSNFKLANLKKTKFIGANLKRTNLQNTELADSDLTEADLTDADLTNAYTQGTILARTNLTRFKLACAWIKIDFTGANIIDAYLPKDIVVQCNFTGVNFAGMDLTEARFLMCNFSHTNLTETNLTNAYLGETNLANANLTRTNLTRTNLDSVKLSDNIELDLGSAEELQKIYQNTSYDIKVRALAKQIAIAKGFSLENWDDPN